LVILIATFMQTLNLSMVKLHYSVFYFQRTNQNQGF
jgi:hypothetical protein